MLITLKQTDIEAGIALFLAGKGIDLHGKTVKVEFTAGRKNGGGLTATADIVEGINLSNGGMAVVAGPLELPAGTSVVEAAVPVAAEAPVAEAKVVKEYVTGSANADEATEASKPVVSLFGG